jgi:hypothetical protein
MGVAIGLLGLLMLPGQVSAQGPSWAYLEAGFNSVDFDDAGVSDDGDGYFAGVSFPIFKSLHVFGRYIDNTTDDLDLDITRWYAGAGWHGMLGEKADLVGEVAYTDAEFDMIDGSGYFGRAGVRWRPIQLVEVGAFGRWEDLGGDIDDSDTIWEANAMVYVWRVSLGLGYETQDELDTFNAFARFNLGGGDK